MVSFFLSIDLTLAGLVLCKIEEKINNTSTPPSGTNVKYPLSSLQRDGPSKLQKGDAEEKS